MLSWENKSGFSFWIVRIQPYVVGPSYKQEHLHGSCAMTQVPKKKSTKSKVKRWNNLVFFFSSNSEEDEEDITHNEDAQRTENIRNQDTILKDPSQREELLEEPSRMVEYEFGDGWI